MKIIAALTEPAAIQAFLAAIGLPARAPPIAPSPTWIANSNSTRPGLSRRDAGARGHRVCPNRRAFGAFLRLVCSAWFLADDPWKALAPFDTTPTTHRRAMTSEEIQRLLASRAPHRRLVYEVAFLSGLRANELRNLTDLHLDRERGDCALTLNTKNRREGFQRMPQSLVRRLEAFAETGEAAELYDIKFHRGSNPKKSIPWRPLPYVPSNTSRDLRKDLKAAGHTPEKGRAGSLISMPAEQLT